MLSRQRQLGNLQAVSEEVEDYDGDDNYNTYSGSGTAQNTKPSTQEHPFIRSSSSIRKFEFQRMNSTTCIASADDSEGSVLDDVSIATSEISNFEDFDVGKFLFK